MTENFEGDRYQEVEEEISDNGQVDSEISDITSDILSKAPGVSEHVIENEYANAESAASSMQDPGQGSGQRDSEGTVFNPDIHATTKDGEPSITKTGKFRKKASVYIKGNESTIGSGYSQPETQDNFPSPGTVAAGKAAVSALFQLGMIIGGDEWAPRVDERYGLNEPKMMDEAFIAYFDAKGIDDIPPGIALIIAIGAYSIPRFALPKTKNRFKIGAKKLSEIMKKIFRKKSYRMTENPDEKENEKNA